MGTERERNGITRPVVRTGDGNFFDAYCISRDGITGYLKGWDNCVSRVGITVDISRDGITVDISRDGITVDISRDEITVDISRDEITVDISRDEITGYLNSHWDTCDS